MRRLLFVVIMLLTLAPAAGAADVDIVVSAAASLTESFNTLKTSFEQSHPGIRVVTNYGASGSLLQQLINGAPVDVFVSADQETMDKAEAGKVVDPASRVAFAENAMVLIAPSGLQSISSLADLAGPNVTRIAIGSPETVPAGRYARDALKSAGLWDSIQEKLIPGNNVKQVLTYVQRGETDAGLVFATDAKAAGDSVRTVAELSGHAPARYYAAVTASTTHKEAAAAFVAFLVSEQGQAVLAGFHFKPVRP